jgi:hypothetical protein
MATTEINWGFVLGQALVEQRRQTEMHDGIKAFVDAYYEDYTDATDLDAAFLGTLRAIGRHLSMSGFDEEDVDNAIREAEAEIRDTGRQVRSLADEDDEDE